MISRFKIYDRLALLLIVILGVVLLLVWAKFPIYKSFSQGDPYLDANQYITGKNFGERGFITEKFLPDYATGPKDCYPLWYTHNPAFSEILSGIYYRLGLHDISQHRPISIAWNLLSAWFFYLLLKQLSSPRTALLALAVFISNPLYIAWGDNLNIHHQWCFIFAGMYLFLKSADDRKRSKILLWSATILFFLLCYSNYEYVPFVAIFFIGVKFLRIRRIPWTRVILPLGAGLMAIAIHQLSVIWAVGHDYWLLDKTETFLHRTGMGVTPLMEIYKKIPLLMWEDKAKLTGGLTLSTHFKSFYLHLENLFGWGWAVLLVAICPLKQYLLPGEPGKRKILIRSIFLFFSMSIFWFIVFAQHTADHQWGSTILLFAPFAAFLFGSVLDGLYCNFIHQETVGNHRISHKGPVRRIIGIVLIILLLSGLVLGRVRTYRPYKAYPGIESLQKYRNRHFLTSSIPTLVSSFTGMPVGWLAGKHPALMYSHARYLVNPQHILSSPPEFFFSPRHPEYPNFARTVDIWLAANYEIEEKGEAFTIYNLKKPLSPSVHSLIDRSRFNIIREKLTRAAGAELKEETKRHRYHRHLRKPDNKLDIAEWITRKILEITGMTPIMESESGAETLSVKSISGNLFLYSSPIRASSIIGKDTDVSNLAYPNPGRYWHVAMDRVGEPAWVTIDLGENGGDIVNFIRTKPRADIRRQTFKTAVIQGSHDGDTWEDISAIIQDNIPGSTDWKGWIFRNDTPYRFYRFFILDGHESNGAFYSLGALELYRAEILNPQ